MTDLICRRCGNEWNEKLKMEKLNKLNLGCGKIYMKGWINSDKNKNSKADVHFDCEKKFPFKTSSIDYIYACHILEHVRDLYGCLNEMKRVCKNNAIIEIRVPHALSIRAYADPTHARFFTYSTFNYFDVNNTDDYDVECPKFEIISRKLSYTALFEKLNFFINPLLNIKPELYERLFGWIFPCGEIRVELKVIKNNEG